MMPLQAVRAAVTELEALAGRHARFLRAVVQIGGNDEQARAVGSEKVSRLGQCFVAAILSALPPALRLRLEPSVQAGFRIAYAGLFFDIIHGADFGAVGLGHVSDDLGDALVAFLVSRGLPADGERPDATA